VRGVFGLVVAHRRPGRGIRGCAADLHRAAGRVALPVGDFGDGWPEGRGAVEGVPLHVAVRHCVDPNGVLRVLKTHAGLGDVVVRVRLGARVRAVHGEATAGRHRHPNPPLEEPAKVPAAAALQVALSRLGGGGHRRRDRFGDRQALGKAVQGLVVGAGIRAMVRRHGRDRRGRREAGQGLALQGGKGDLALAPNFDLPRGDFGELCRVGLLGLHGRSDQEEDHPGEAEADETGTHGHGPETKSAHTGEPRRDYSESERREAAARYDSIACCSSRAVSANGVPP